MPVAFFIFILIPLVELAVIIEIGSLIGVFPTIALLVLSAIIGIALLRKEGLTTLMKARQRQNAGQSPEFEALESIIIALSSCLMILPGFITDIIGLCGLIPFVRHLLIRKMKQRIIMHTTGYTFEGEPADKGDTGHSSSKERNIIEGKFERKTDNFEKK